MICRRCLRLRVASSAFRTQFPIPITRSISSTASSRTDAPPFSTPLSSSPSTTKPPPPKQNIPASSIPAGTPLKGLNYLKGRDDPVALPDEEYPDWLWRCLDAKEEGTKGGEVEGDEFSKSKKQRRLAAKRKAKLEARLLAEGKLDMSGPKIPIQKQSIDLPWNESGSVQGAFEAAEKREELRRAMRQERRAKIKETNYLKSM